ncbi:MAG: prepilin-type N-terminal cleavage/methylation domain-containing protein [Psychrobium sp.]
MDNSRSSNFKKAKGFTLIELIIVIIILGILAVTAAPKFINIQGDAKKAVRTALVGSISSVMTIGNAKAAIAGVTGDGEVSISGSVINVKNGYPDVVADASADGTATKAYNLLELLDLSGVTTTSDRTSTGTTITLSIASDCTVILTQAGASGSAVVTGDATCS